MRAVVTVDARVIKLAVALNGHSIDGDPRAVVERQTTLCSPDRSSVDRGPVIRAKILLMSANLDAAPRVENLGVDEVERKQLDPKLAGGKPGVDGRLSPLHGHLCGVVIDRNPRPIDSRICPDHHAIAIVRGEARGDIVGECHIRSVEPESDVSPLDGDVAIVSADFIAGLGGESGFLGVVGDVVLEIDVAAVVVVTPARAIVDHVADHQDGIHRHVGAGHVNVERVATFRVGSGSRNEEAVLIDHRVVDRKREVRSSQSVECAVFGNHVVVVHEHHVAAMCVVGGILRGEVDIPREIGDFERLARLRRGSSERDGSIQSDRQAVGRESRDHELFIQPARCTGDVDQVAHFPTERSPGQNDRGRSDRGNRDERNRATLGGTKEGSRTLAEQAPAESIGIPNAIDWAVVGEDDIRGHSRGDRCLGGSHDERTHRVDFDRVDAQAGILGRREIQRAADADRM